VSQVPVPLFQRKAEFFPVLGHPVRLVRRLGLLDALHDEGESDSADRLKAVAR
jgi:hypothetical protein